MFITTESQTFGGSPETVRYACDCGGGASHSGAPGRVRCWCGQFMRIVYHFKPKD